MPIIESAGITDVGEERENNEDALLLDDNKMLYIVADGMGGYSAGDVASKMVVETIQNCIEKAECNGEEHELIDPDETLSIKTNRLLSGIQLANREVYNTSQENEKYRGMGATVSVVYFSDDFLTVANVGDSPVYLVHRGTMERISVLHTVIAEYEATDSEDAERISKEYRHMLTRAMGTEETVKADVCELQYFKGDILVICSDGLSGKVPPEEILDIVNKERTDKACQLLVDLANERGGDDNITVIVLKVASIKRQRAGAIGWILGLMKGLLNLK